MPLDLTEDEHRALVEHPAPGHRRRSLPALAALPRAAGHLAKLDPVERPEPLPAPKAGEPSMALARRRRQRR